MIYITGDTHGDRTRFLCLQGESQWTEKDILIVCGDFGYVSCEDAKKIAFLDELEKKPYTICFADGNHEDFPAIESFPVEHWHGGKVHRIRQNILHLMRGQIFEIEGKKFFTMGGAYSVDKAIKSAQGLWWAQEQPNDAEYKEAWANLTAHDKKVDYIITHTAPEKIIYLMNKFPDPHERELSGFLSFLRESITYERWFFGHWHMDEVFEDKLLQESEFVPRFRAIYWDVEAIGE